MSIANIMQHLSSMEDIDDNNLDDINDNDDNINDNKFINNNLVYNKKSNNFLMLYKNDSITIFVEDDDEDNNKSFNYYCNKINNFTIFITNMIDYDIKTYLMFAKLLKNVIKNSTIDIYINTCGGFVNSGVFIISAMEQCKCKITTHVPNFAASMGAVIMTFGDEIEIDNDALIMFHGIQSYYVGNIADVTTNINNLSGYDNRMLKKALDKKIITEDEFEDLKNGKDLYLLGKTINQRINE